MKVCMCKQCMEFYLFLDSSEKVLSCCNEPLENLEVELFELENDSHPIEIKKTGNFYKVQFKNYKTLDIHHIKYLILKTNLTTQIKKIENQSDITFLLDFNEEVENLYAYCNIHGLISYKLYKKRC